jgi:hypothetical protein
MFSYYQIHPTIIIKTAGGPSSEDGVTAQVSETTCYQSFRTGFYLSFGAKLLCKAHHTADSYLQLWYWAYFESYLSWHVIEFTFTAALPREEANLKVHFKGSLESLREMQASLVVLPRKASLAFPRKQMHLVSPHHFRC